MKTIVPATGNKGYHEAHPYVQNPIHKITIALIGAGGTGSRMLTHLAMMNQALVGLGHKGIFVVVYDDDKVSTSNIGRQVFSPADIGYPKAAVLVQRVNRFYGTNWDYSVTRVKGAVPGNIIITCVDTKAARRIVDRSCHRNRGHEEDNLYWLDCGNSKTTGQVILSTKFKKQEGSILLSPSKLYNGIFLGKEDNEPSCSVAEALAQQDLFINPTIALFASQLLYRLLTEGRIDYQGAFVNLESLAIRKIAIQHKN
ncbi:MAG: PRTRC system ThiF family protein [Cytophagales bacterium]|nr:PRTRC system ThiF family protein [Cytophagales bacterium]